MILPQIPKCFSNKLALYILIILCLCVVLQIWAVSHFVELVDIIMSVLSIPRNNLVLSAPDKEIKYILIWNKSVLLMEHGASIFPSLNCPVKNCQFTNNKYLLNGDYINFDVVLFNDDDLSSNLWPTRRNKSQLYIFSSTESSYNKPACEVYNDDFFNWTFTYRLDSTIPWHYFLVFNKTGHIVAPKINATWEENSEPLTPEIKDVLSGKTRTAAWLVSHCEADSLRNDYLTKLQEHLLHFSLKIDVYGKCTEQKCENDDCDGMIRKHYYFYMAFENSLSEDYVTEKVLHGYNNLAVPVVYGVANYNRFLPDGSYINARLFHPYNLAFTMSEAIKNPEKLEDYFRWTNLYRVAESNVTHHHPTCRLCAALNGGKKKEYPAIKKFRQWWNGLNGMKWCLSEAYWNETSYVNIDGSHIFNLY